MPLLKKFTISQIKFGEILEDRLTNFSDTTLQVSDINNFINGYKDFYNVRYASNAIIMPLNLANLYNVFDDDDTDEIYIRNNYQVILEKATDISQIKTNKIIYGSQAWNFMKQKICKYYTEEEFEKTLTFYNCECDENHHIMHSSIFTSSYGIYKYSNCFYYDLNSAYAWGLTQMFPKATQEIKNIYRQRKKKPEMKQYLNLFTGMVKKKGYEGAYWHLIGLCYGRMKQTLNDLCGPNTHLVYANTDGVALSNPIRTLIPSNELGEYKLEFAGDIYTYQEARDGCTKYSIMQYGDEVKGTLRQDMRKNVDLRIGQVVHFHQSRINTRVDEDGNKHYETKIDWIDEPTIEYVIDRDTGKVLNYGN